MASHELLYLWLALPIFLFLGWSYTSLTVTRSPLSDAWEPLAELIVAATEGAPPGSLARLGGFDLSEGASVRDLGA